VLADETGRGPVPGATKFRLRWLAAVVAIMTLLTIGWPLLNSTVANMQPLRAGAKITIGAGRDSGTVTIGPGWYVQPAQSNPMQRYLLIKGGVVLDIRHVSLVDRLQLGLIWLGMRKILAVTHPGSELSEPVSTTTVNGRPALTGAVSGLGLIGMGIIVAAPSRDFAIAMVMLAPHGTNRALMEAARRIEGSLIFTAPSR
jgi:hypothetical protein